MSAVSNSRNSKSPTISSTPLGEIGFLRKLSKMIKIKKFKLLSFLNSLIKDINHLTELIVFSLGDIL